MDGDTRRRTDAAVWAIVVTVAITVLTWTVGGVWVVSNINTRAADDERRITALETNGQVQLNAIQGQLTSLQVDVATVKTQVQAIPKGR